MKKEENKEMRQSEEGQLIGGCCRHRLGFWLGHDEQEMRYRVSVKDLQAFAICVFIAIATTSHMEHRKAEIVLILDMALGLLTSLLSIYIPDRRKQVMAAKAGAILAAVALAISLSIYLPGELVLVPYLMILLVIFICSEEFVELAVGWFHGRIDGLLGNFSKSSKMPSQNGPDLESGK